MSACVSDATLHMRSLLTEGPKQPEPRVFQWRRCLVSAVIAAPLPREEAVTRAQCTVLCFQRCQLHLNQRLVLGAAQCQLPILDHTLQ